MKLPSFKKLFYLDVRSLSLFRIALASTLLIDLVLRLNDLEAFYTGSGVLPKDLAPTYYNYIFPHFFFDSYMWQICLFIIQGIFAITLLIGYKTRLSLIISWYLYTSLINRNPFIMHGGDVIIKMFLFWGIFLPLNARFSLDIVKNYHKLRIKNPAPSLSAFAFIFQFATLFVFAAIYKLNSSFWLNGTAIHFSLSAEQWATNIGQFMLLFPSLLIILTYTVILIEFIAPILYILIRSEKIKLLIVLIFILMIIGFGLNLTLNTFPLATLTVILGLIPAIFWDKLSKFLEKKRFYNLTIYYDDRCNLCQWIVNFLAVFTLYPKIIIIPASTNPQAKKEMSIYNSWIILYKNKKYYGFDGIRLILKFLPLTFLFAPIFNLIPEKLGVKIYKMITGFRKIDCDLYQKNKIKFTSHKLNKFSMFIIGFSICSVMFVNLHGLWNFRFIPQNVDIVRSFFYQRWDMFSPPPKDTVWIETPGLLEDKTYVDVYTETINPTYNKPKLLSGPIRSGFYKNVRWAIFIHNIAERPPFLQSYAFYLCRNWNEKNQNSLNGFSIYYVTHENEINNRNLKPSKLFKGRFSCN